MDNNDILRRLRYAFDFDDATMIGLFAQADYIATRSQVSNWLKKEDHDDFVALYDRELATFLNGLINDRRGKREGPQPTPEKTLNNNIIMRKLRIALNLRDDDILAILESMDQRVSKPELSALFRKPDHRSYRLCKDQFLRNFIYGLAKKYRPEG